MKIKIYMTIVIVMLCCNINSYATEIEEETQAEDEVSEEKTQTEELQEQKEELEEEIEQTEEELEELQKELSSNLLQLQKLDEKIRDSEAEVLTLKVEIEELQISIDEVELELSIVEEQYIRQKTLLDSRLIAVYESAETTYLDVLVNSTNIGDFISGIFLITELVQSDKNLLEDVQIQKEEVEMIKKRLDRDKEQVAIKIADQTTTNNLLQNTKTLREKYVVNLSEEEKEIQYKIDEFYEQFEYIDSQILEFARKELSGDYIGGELAWPVPGYSVITSEYGMRTHPITGVYKLHTGVDISAPTGASFIAVNDGLVVTAGYNGAYGNMVIIDHGGGIMSLYAHGSEIMVEQGDMVTRNQEVLKVGSTGYSTGPHAHFEIRLDGVCVNPMPYITKQETLDDNEDEVTEE